MSLTAYESYDNYRYKESMLSASYWNIIYWIDENILQLLFDVRRPFKTDELNGVYNVALAIVAVARAFKTVFKNISFKNPRILLCEAFEYIF